MQDGLLQFVSLVDPNCPASEPHDWMPRLSNVFASWMELGFTQLRRLFVRCELDFEARKWAATCPILFGLSM